jgi:hypothetical protein
MCKERTELIKRLDAAALGFSTALDQESFGPVQDGPEVRRLRQVVLQAEQAWESAQTAFLGHVKEHRCTRRLMLPTPRDQVAVGRSSETPF